MSKYFCLACDWSFKSKWAVCPKCGEDGEDIQLVTCAAEVAGWESAYKAQKVKP